MISLKWVPSRDIGLLFLRLAVGGLMLFHGIAKMGRGIGFIQQTLEAVGIPGFIGYGVYLAEVAAPVLILLGYQARIASLVIAFEMVVAVILAHWRDITALQPSGAWGIELEVFYFLAALALFSLGPGKYRVTMIAHEPWHRAID